MGLPRYVFTTAALKRFVGSRADIDPKPIRLRRPEVIIAVRISAEP
jgi:hypothetical protein